MFKMFRLSKVTAALFALLAFSDAACPNSCSGHGVCNKFDECTCYIEQRDGDSAEIPAWREPDCSARACPRGISHIHIPEYGRGGGVYSHAVNAECSDRGICNTDIGECECFSGWTGSACQYSFCPEERSSNGICQSNTQFAFDVSRVRTGETPEAFVSETDSSFSLPIKVNHRGAWDSGIMFGMKCDLGHRGITCSEIECPSGADPLGFEGGAQGRVCSGRGHCDYANGVCECFDDFTGADCSIIAATM